MRIPIVALQPTVLYACRIRLSARDYARVMVRMVLT